MIARQQPTMVRRLAASNFKSFESVDVELDPLTVLVGGNASGKSNFVQILAFLRDLARHGLENAVSMQGGAEFLCNMAIGTKEPVGFSLTARPSGEASFRMRRLRSFRLTEDRYSVSFAFNKRGRGTIVRDERELDFEVVEGSRGDSTPPRVVGSGTMLTTIAEKRYKQEIRWDPDGVKLADEDIPFYLPTTLLRRVLARNQPIISSPLRFYGLGMFDPEGIGIFDFDPKLPKRAVAITGRADLEGDGSNLAMVIRNLLRTPRSRKRLIALLQDLLPFVHDLAIERVADKTVLFAIKDKYLGQRRVPASFLSDGTVNVAALIIALFFVPRQVTVLEEPERNIHPHLISRVVELLKQAATERQVIVSTHNSEVVRQAGIEPLLFVSRDEKGRSQLSRPRDNKAAKIFLSEEFGLDELFIQNLLATPS